ncbi:RagB/SusD family nutrient uptake outer membrane protein [Fulvivirga sp. M361]|uniref:RagB/SusD family nutrient uptake outer membrane protein n=1 Tax=Fulvivirga sp. M361 TaxID=2594266 RepID=UPI00117B7CF0|nr:RagB/SusD family nutrient uptake outer membrane protein [Fulvivirga sp. M361]TRX50931.1 RagB/SusD family nutrient uptake outer membrane protein [Fulvivirga sp. M361]
MKNIIINFKNLLIALSVAFIITSCDMDIPNPNAATLTEASGDQAGLIAMSAGMGIAYQSALERIILTPGITAREVEVTNTFINLLELGEGGTVLSENNGNIIGLWSRLYRVIGTADVIIANASEVISDPAVESAVLGVAHFYKAASLGYLIQSFERVPTSTNADGNAMFSSRADVLAEAIKLLDDASALLSSNAPSSSVVSSFGNDFDLVNMINAYRARLNLMAGNFQAAIDAANLVDLTSESYFTFNSENQNPIFLNTNLATEFNYSPIDDFGIEGVNPADGRIDFYLDPVDSTGQFDFNISFLKGFFDESDKSIPVYLPGEVTLIKAEAFARLNQLDMATEELDKILTKTDDPMGVNADLPAYSGPNTQEAILAEILKNRNIELFLTGLRLEDSKRFGQTAPPASTQFRNRNLYPYPDTERATNPNTPDDPSI